MSCVPLQNKLVYSTLSIRLSTVWAIITMEIVMSNSGNILFTNGSFFNLTLPNVYTGMAVGHACYICLFNMSPYLTVSLSAAQSGRSQDLLFSH